MASTAQSSNTAEIRKPLNIFWVETLRLEIPYDIVRSDVGVVFQSHVFHLPLQREDLFCFHVTKISPNDILIQCMRGPAYYPDREGDRGYILRFYFTMIGIDEPPKPADMRTDQSEATVILKTEYFTKKLLEGGYGSYVWQLRVLIRMLEYDNLPDDHVCKAEYDKMFESFKQECVKTPKKEEVMTFLLRPGSPLGNMFSGRQSELFVMIKLTYIKRASYYCNEIVGFFKMQQMMMMMPDKKPEVPYNFDFPVVLNFICTGNKTPIAKDDLLELFLRAYRFGMNFLKVICTYYMIEKLVDPEFLIDALKVADMVDDPILLNKSMDVFIPNRSVLFRSPKWKEFHNESNSAALSLVHALTFRAKYQELRVPAKVMDYMEESGTAS